MTWWLPIVCALAYAFMGLSIAILCKRLDKGVDTPELLGAIAILWPLAIPIGLATFVLFAVGHSVEAVSDILERK